MARKLSTRADLPSTPADLEQRQGRAVRQDDTLNIVQLFYYFPAQPSQRRTVEPVVAPTDTTEEVLP